MIFSWRARRGQSILEIMIALAIFSLIGSAIAVMVLGGFRALEQGGEFSEAEALAQEAIEAARSIRDRAWNENIYGQSAVEAVGGNWRYQGEGTTETIGRYSRTVVFNDVCRDNNHNIAPCPASYKDVQSKEIVVTVQWTGRSGTVNTVTESSYITNWETRDWKQTDWSGRGGQTIWSNQAKYDTDDGNLIFSQAGQTNLGQTLSASGFYDWNFSSSAGYSFAPEKIEFAGGYARLKSAGGQAGETLDSGFEYTSATSTSWDFSSAGNYVYDSNKIEFVSGVARLKVSGGSLASGTTVNPGFDTNTSGWTYNDWSQDAGDPDATGAFTATGGNPGGYVNVNLPSNLRNRNLGGWWEQSFSVSVANPSLVKCEFDWRALTATNGANLTSLYVAVYLEKAGGVPATAPVLTKNFSAPFAWESHSGANYIDCSAKVDVAGTYYYKIAVWAQGRNANAGPITVGFDNAKVYWEKQVSGSYPSDGPYIYPNASFSAPGVQAWSGFQETAVKNGGEIFYQLSNDDGLNWRFWDGSSWAVIAGASDYNTAVIANANISSFPITNEKIKFRAFLKGDGSQQVVLDDVKVVFIPSPAVWNFSAWDAGGGEVTPTGAKYSTGGSPNGYVDINIPSGSNDKIGGYWQQAFFASSSNPSLSVDFDYKVFSFSGAPTTAEIRIYVDNAPGAPTRQVGGSIPFVGPTSWAAAARISDSGAVTATGTYYLKIAVWVETPSSGAGPFNIGFDDVKLSWSAASYPADQPTVGNSASFSPALITSWTSFIETADKNGGEIFYQLSNDDGATWKYWRGDLWASDPDGDEGALENDYSPASEVTSYINLFDASGRKLMFKAFLKSGGSELVQLDNIKVTYNISSANYYGNSFVIDLVEGAGLLTMTHYDKQSDIRFTAGRSASVNSVMIYLEQEKGVSPVYRYGLQADNNGAPSQTYLGASGQAFADFQATTTGWQTITLNESAVLTAGQTYHLLIRYQSGSISNNDAIELRRARPNNFRFPFDGSSNPSSNVLWSTDGGASWLIESYQPLYILNFTSGSSEGNPYHDAVASNVFGSNYYGEEFTVSGLPESVSSIGFYVSKNSIGLSDSLYFSFFDVTNNNLLATGTLATDASISSANIYEWQTFIFDAPTILSPGNIYRVYVYSPASTASKYYLVKAISNENTPFLNSLNYAGENAYYVYSNDAGSSWITTEKNKDIGGFRFSSTLFKTSGYLISSAFNAGTSSAFNTIDWQGIFPSCSPACEARLQIQTAPNAGGAPGVWSSTWCGPEGEDGDEIDYFSYPYGEMISKDHNGDQWIRYKATLVGDSTDSPVLEDVNITYKNL